MPGGYSGSQMTTRATVAARMPHASKSQPGEPDRRSALGSQRLVDGEVSNHSLPTQLAHAARRAQHAMDEVVASDLPVIARGRGVIRERLRTRVP